MNVYIDNCFHWIGFHLAEKFLNEGASVIGLDQIDGEQKEFLYGMIGRNANFTLVDSVQDVKEKGMVIHPFCNGDVNLPTIDAFNFLGDQYYIIEESQQSLEKTKRKSNHYRIEIPPLIGPWMKINHMENLLNKHPIYIEDFIEWFYNFCTLSNKPNEMILAIKNKSNNEMEAKRRTNITLLQKTKHADIRKKLEEHTKKFQLYYKLT